VLAEVGLRPTDRFAIQDGRKGIMAWRNAIEKLPRVSRGAYYDGVAVMRDGEEPPTGRKAMPKPVPVCKCFVLCRQLFNDPVRQDYTVVSPIHQLFSSYYPLVERLAMFARWTNAHGTYDLELQLRNLEGDIVWGVKEQEPFQATDPLQVWIVPLYNVRLRVPAPGKYDIVLLASGVEVARDTIQAHLVG
jgi:hypothetical protein